MIVLDANIILYSYMPRFSQHAAVLQWLEKTLRLGENSIGIPWQAATAFIRISTSRRAFDKPYTIANARACLDELFSHPLVVPVNPTEKHWRIYSKILVEQNMTGDIVMDAHI